MHLKKKYLKTIVRMPNCKSSESAHRFEKEPMEFLHIKNTIIEIRTSMRGFKSGLSIVEEARHDR